MDSFQRVLQTNEKFFLKLFQIRFRNICRKPNNIQKNSEA